MARSGVRYEDVERAVDTLLAQGETPSVQKVREVLGTGSFTTLSEHLRAWRARRDETRDALSGLGIPESVATLAERVWEHAQEAANEALGEYREQADRQMAAAQEAAQQAQRKAEDAVQREAALAQHLADIQQRLEARSADLATIEAERDQWRQDANRLSGHLSRLNERFEELQAEHERKDAERRATLEQREAQHRERLAQEEQRHESAEARLMGLLDEARQERQTVEKARAARERQLESRLDALQKQLEETRGALAEEEKRYRESDWARSRAEEQAATRQREQGLLQERVDEQKRLLEEQARRLRELEAQLDHWLWQMPARDVDDGEPDENT
ncbi:DNA-binding protein [Halomonas faecis]|uniref:DNA-binding protein n=1 Tax=Halomonas faecis TaxID=1562110 RepID=UPI0013D01D31|nr:DNA-binding protein [Halomonas faecis]